MFRVLRSPPGVSRSETKPKQPHTREESQSQSTQRNKPQGRWQRGVLVTVDILVLDPGLVQQIDLVITNEHWHMIMKQHRQGPVP